ncbi:MAG: ComEC/Rec2 family competence protein [Oscillospiraceae bacterium]
MKRPMFVLGLSFLIETLVVSILFGLNLSILVEINIILMVVLLFFKIGKLKKIILLTMILAILLFYFNFQYNVLPILELDNKTLKLKGEIVKIDNNINNNYTDIYLKVKDKSRLNNKTVFLRNYTNNYNEIGDFINTEVSFKVPVNQDDNNIKSYYNSRKIFAIGTIKNLEIINHSKTILYFLNLLKQNLKISLSKILPGIEGDILNGLILGEKDNIDKLYIEKMSTLGVSHIMAISGLHISVIGISILYFLKLLKLKRLANILTIMIMFTYLLIVGSSPSIVRATIMFSLFLLSDIFKRYRDTLSSLGFSLIIILLINPYSLYSIGFMLSFTAVLSIAIISKPINMFLHKYFRNKILIYVFSIILISTFISIITLPIISYYFGEINLLSPIINMLILPFMSVTLVTGMLTMILSFVQLTLLSKIIGVISGSLVKVLIRLIDLSDNILNYKILLFDNSIFIYLITFYVVFICYVLLYRKTKYVKVLIILTILCQMSYLITMYNQETIFIDNDGGKYLYFKKQDSNILIFNGHKSEDVSDLIKFIKDKEIKEMLTVVFLNDITNPKDIDKILKNVKVKDVIIKSPNNIHLNERFNVYKLDNINYKINDDFYFNYNSYNKDYLLNIQYYSKKITFTSDNIDQSHYTDSDIIVKNNDGFIILKGNNLIKAR